MILLIDIGGTSTRLATSSGEDGISEPVIFNTPSAFNDAMSAINQQGKKLAGNGQFDQVCVGVPGPLNADRTMIHTSPNLPDWQQKPLKQELQAALNSPVHLANDADLGGLGEAVYGAGQGHEIVAYLTISTGIGGTRVVRQSLDINAIGFEPGHQVIVSGGDQCNCGGKGHLESYVSGAAIQRRYNKEPKNITDSKVWDEITQYLAVGLNNVAVHWSPHCIVLGGSIMNKIELPKLRDYFSKTAVIFPDPPPIVEAQLGTTAGLHGALIHARAAAA